MSYYVSGIFFSLFLGCVYVYKILLLRNFFGKKQSYLCSKAYFHGKAGLNVKERTGWPFSHTSLGGWPCLPRVTVAWGLVPRFYYLEDGFLQCIQL